MAELNVQLRETRGKRNARRLRNSGSIPAVLYGHGQEAVALTIPAEGMEDVMRHGARLVNLVGAVREQAFLREVQWDTWGSHVLHVDLTRISEHEKVQVEVAVELRGEAPGVRNGGVVTQHLHELEIECEVSSIPEKLFVKVNHLNLGDRILVKDLELPPTVSVLIDPELIVVECHEPAEEAEVEAAAEGAEPELIGRKAGEEEEAAE
jgi:large subunit ribosomal protein L25